MKGRRRWIAGLILIAGMAVPSVADAADCTLTGSGLETSSTDLSRFQPATGTLKASMLFVDFSDHAFDPAEDPPDYPGNFPNPPSIGHKLVDWASTYLSGVSGGRLALDVKMDTHWVHLGQPASHYNFSTFNGQRDFMIDAVNAADSGFDFSGRQTLYVVSAPTGGVLPNSPAFIGPGGFGVPTSDGVTIHWGASFGDDVRRASPDYGAHVLAHETSHTLGLPDLYSFQQAFDFNTAHLNAGSWDRMGWIGPSFGYLGWHSLKLGWLDPAQAVCVDGEATATLSPMASAGETKMLISKTSSNTAYVAEVRASTGVDSGICHEGVLIYRVDANGATGGPPGAGPIVVKLSDPNNPGDPSDQNCGAIANAPFGVGQTFAEGPVTVEVLSGTPATGYAVRMTGPAQAPPSSPTGPSEPTDPSGPTGPTGTAQTGGVERKLHLDGKKHLAATLICPAAASSCAGTATVALPDATKLATGPYAIVPPGGEVSLKLNRKARRALANAFGRKDKTGATVVLNGAAGKITKKVKLIR